MAQSKKKPDKKPLINKEHKSLSPVEWNKLKDLFTQSNLSLLKFSKEQCVNYKTARNHYVKENWKKSRNTFQAKVGRSVEVKAIANWLKTFDKLGGAWEKLLNCTIKSLEPDTIEGKAIPITLYSQTQAAQVLDKITHNLRLLSGQSTENINNNNDAEFKEYENNDDRLQKEIDREIKEIAEIKANIKRESGKKKV